MEVQNYFDTLLTRKGNGSDEKTTKFKLPTASADLEKAYLDYGDKVEKSFSYLLSDSGIKSEVSGKDIKEALDRTITKLNGLVSHIDVEMSKHKAVAGVSPEERPLEYWSYDDNINTSRSPVYKEETICETVGTSLQENWETRENMINASEEAVAMRAYNSIAWRKDDLNTEINILKTAADNIDEKKKFSLDIRLAARLGIK